MEMTPEARALLALIEQQRKNPMARALPGMVAAFDAIGAYVQRSEVRMVALEESARVHAEVLLDRHYGRRPNLSTDQLRTLAIGARDESTLRALDAGTSGLTLENMLAAKS